MCHVDGIWHILLSLIGSITELKTLVTGTDGIQLVLVHIIFFLLKSLVNTHSDICGLFVKSCDHCTGICIKTILCIVISDLADSITNDLLDINVSLCCDLTHNKYKTRSSSSLACNTAHRILLHHSVKDGIGNRVADFVRMSFSYRFRCK